MYHKHMAHPDLDSLLNTCIELASELLQKNGEFFPFGASINQEGQPTINARWAGDDKPLSQEVIDLLTDGFKESAESGDIVACVICADVKLNGSDAIRCQLDHKDDKPVTVLVPYTLHKEQLENKIELGEISAQTSDLKFFS